MISTYAELVPKTGARDAVVQVAFIAAAYSYEEPGCISSVASRNGDNVIMREQWADADAYRAHVAGDHYVTMLKDLEPLVEGTVTFDALDEEDIASR